MANSTPPPGALIALLREKCPRCRRGDLFSHGPFQLQRFTEMPTHCPHCGLKFEREPGFFWGAMYVTYAFTVAIFVAVLLVLWNFAGNPPVWVYLITMIILAGGTAPLQVRYSRAVMLYAFSDVRFDSTYYYGPPREPEAQDDTSDQLDAAEIQRAYQGYIEDSEQQQQ